MIAVELQTARGEFVTRGEIPVLRQMPEVMLWGGRTFKHGGIRGDTALYKEVFVWVLVGSDPPAPKPRSMDDYVCANCGHDYFDHANGSRACDYRAHGNALECGCPEWEPKHKVAEKA